MVLTGLKAPTDRPTNTEYLSCRGPEPRRDQKQGGGAGLAVIAGWMDCLAAELFLDSCFSDTIHVTLFRTTVGTAFG